MDEEAMNLIACIPSKPTSQRIPGKNIRLLAGHPLLAYSVAAARESGVFSRVLVVSESEEIGKIGEHYGAEWFKEEPVEGLGLDSRWVLSVTANVNFDAFAILRPTSPFRTADTIRRAVRQFMDDSWCDSLRAVEPVRQTPYKMWKVEGYRMTPLLEGTRPIGYRGTPVPYHSMPTQLHPKVWMQNASIEVAHMGRWPGERIAPFFTGGAEGKDLNTEEDWEWAERNADLLPRL